MLNKKVERILPSVQKPARYTGGEYNSVIKDKESVDLRVAFCFPDTYEVGMSHLGSRILYGLYNSRQDIWCERVFAPWIDMEKAMRDNDIPLYALESGDALSDFNLIAFTLQYELSYTNILNMLDMGGVPVLASERTTLDHLIVAGGPCAYNPEPLHEFVDAFMIGDGEEVSLELADVYINARKEGITKDELLCRLAKINGVYVPSLYDVSYNEDGTIKEITPKGDAPKFVQKRIVMDLDDMYYPEYFVVPSTDIVFDRAMVELFRGCPRGCRFCQAGHTYRPLRKKSADTLLKQAKSLIETTGYEEISLSSLSTSDYSELERLTLELLDHCEERCVSLSLPSLRADNFSTELMEKVQKVRKSGLTFAPEAGSQRLRDVINKNILEEDILNACTVAFQGGWNNVKLYFMIGLPTETYEDLDAIADLARKVAYAWKVHTTNKNRGVKITVSSSSFVPKPQTPFQWVGQDEMRMLREKQMHLKDALKTKNVTYSWHDAKTSRVEAIFARGDRRLSRVIYDAWKSGCVFDGWDDCFSLEKWMEAMEKNNLSADFYANRQRTKEEIFPWEHIGCGTTKEHLWQEYSLALETETTPSCSIACSNCGARKLLDGGECIV